jgi:malonate transporter and related proteins
VTGVLLGFGIIGFVILVGYAAARFSIVGDQGGLVLNRVAYFITNPALLFTVIARSNLRDVFTSAVLIELVVVVVVAGIYVAISAVFFRRPVTETTVGALASSYVNANNIGLPVATYVLGSAIFVAPVLLLQLLVIAPIGLTILDISSKGTVSVWRIVSQPLRNPMIVASALGVIVAATRFTVPSPVLEPLTLLAGAAIPLVLMAFGMSLRGAKPLGGSAHRTEALIATALKSIVMPVFAYLLGAFVFDLNGRMLLATVLLAGLPTAQNIFNFASRFDRGVELARDVVLYTTILAVPALFLGAALLS